MERDAPLDRWLFDVEIPYAEEKMIETSRSLEALRTSGLGFSNPAAFF
jgi:hypothetical protein